MLRPRIIPCLLLKGRGLYKTEQFKSPRYIGDPLNAVRIFNEKEVDELIFLDIEASKENREPDYELIRDIATECFMPFAYGGGIRTVEQIQKILSLGAEKVIINSGALKSLRFITEASGRFGSQSIVVSIDVKQTFLKRYRVYDAKDRELTSVDPVDFAKSVEAAGAGEVFVTSVDREGTCLGYDLRLVEQVSKAVTIPVVACGGAWSISHFSEALEAGASGAAAGSFFVFQGPRRAVLITYPEPSVIAGLSSRPQFTA